MATEQQEAREREEEARELDAIRRGKRELSRPSASLLARVAADDELAGTITRIEFFMYHSLTEDHFVLKDLPHLKELSFYDASGVDALVEHLRGKESVEDFSDWCTDLKATNEELLSVFPNLKRLCRDGSPVDIEELRTSSGKNVSAKEPSR